MYNRKRGFFCAGLTNVRVIKSFVRENYEEEKFDEANGVLKDASMAAFRVVIFQTPLMSLLMNITTLSVVWFGGKQIMVGENGEIIERGDHDELLAMKGRYYDLYMGTTELA